MKANCACLHSATVYGAVVMDAIGSLMPNPRITVFSGRPMQWVIEPMNEVMRSELGEKVAAMLDASGAKYRITFTPTQGANIALIRKDTSNQNIKIAGYDRFIVFSEEDIVHADLDAMPVEVYQKLSGMAPDSVEELTSDQLLERIHDRVRRTKAMDEAHGLNDHGELDQMLGITNDEVKQQLTDLSVTTSDTVFAQAASEEGKTPGIIHGENSRFVPVMATDFKDAHVVTPDGTQRRIPMLRIAHVTAPEWCEAEGAVRKAGVAGCWLFKTAAIGEGLSENVVSYTTVSGLRVTVTKASSITPAGQIAVPLAVWRSMMPDAVEPEATMNEDEAWEFTNSHAMTLAQSCAPSSGKAN